jgi:protein-L-isoaspartate(D-aspartate) O-methyltransferase
VAVTIACGQTISQPFVVALMTSLLQLRGYERVLEIGTGSGYQAAVLARLCRRVHTIERWPQLARSAAAQLAAQKIDNVEWRCGDGSLGWPEAAPFDGILVTCAATAVPPPLLGQLSHGGCLVAPIGEPWEVQQLTLVRRDETGTLHHRAVLPVRFVPLVAGVPPASGLRSGR